MFKGQPFLGLPFSSKSANLSLKLALGVFFLVFLTGIQPSLTLNPIKNTVVLAQAQEQTASITPEAVPVVFQLPHPGYLSTHYSYYHPGIDIATGLGMPIKPIAPGTVVDTGFNFFGLGLIVVVDHGSGYQSLYSHLGKIYVKKGQTIGYEDYLGEVGLTGNTSGPHTHLQLSKDGKNIDPAPLLPSLGRSPKPEDLKPVDKEKAASVSADSIQTVKDFIPSPSVKAAATPIPTPTPAPVEPKQIIETKIDTLKDVLTTWVPAKEVDPLTKNLELTKQVNPLESVILTAKNLNTSQPKTLTFAASNTVQSKEEQPKKEELNGVLNNFVNQKTQTPALTKNLQLKIN